MARLPRFVIPGHPQHIIVRGNNREAIFYADEDYAFYLERLMEACRKHGCECHAYVLMTKHVHLLLTPQLESSISKAIQMIGRYYVVRLGMTGDLNDIIGQEDAITIESDPLFLNHNK
mgnify:CR=1 FL=1